MMWLHMAVRRVSVRRIDIAIVAFTVAAVLLSTSLSIVHGRAWAWMAVAGCLAALAFKRRPLAAGLLIVTTSMFLRLAYFGIGYSTQVDHARTAWERVLSGESPYGVLLPSLTAPPEPFTYGPLGLLWWQPGVVVELVAAAGVLCLLAWTQSWLTLALYAGVLPFSVYLNPIGVNDYSPGLLIAGALLLARQRPIIGAILLAVAAAIKPYAFAWFVPMLGYLGLEAALVLGATTVLLWSPLLAWGPATFLRSVQLHADVHPVSQNALDLPRLRWIALPLAGLGLLFRSWTGMVLTGTCAFVAYLFLDRWASLGYWLAVVPIAGIALESHLSPTQRLSHE